MVNIAAQLPVHSTSKQSHFVLPDGFLLLFLISEEGHLNRAYKILYVTACRTACLQACWVCSNLRTRTGDFPNISASSFWRQESQISSKLAQDILLGQKISNAKLMLAPFNSQHREGDLGHNLISTLLYIFSDFSRWTYLVWENLAVSKYTVPHTVLCVCLNYRLDGTGRAPTSSLLIKCV